MKLQMLFADPIGRARQKLLLNETMRSTFCSTVLLQALNGTNVSVPGYGAYVGHTNARLSSSASNTRPHWQPGLELSVADIVQLNGDVHPLCSRSMLDTITGRLSNSGHEALVGLEIEFYLIPASLIRDSRSRHYSPSSIPRAQYGSINNVVIEELADAAERCEISVDSVHREYENLQYEFALGPTDPLRAADNALIFREMARSVARKHGAWACFMPKPFTDEFGSGMHINISVDSGVPARGDVAQLSPTVANLQSVAAHFPACCAIWNPTVNSYRRLRGADFSNISLPVGEERRDTFLRIADSAATNHKRMEFRLPDAVSNPYTSIAVCLSLLSADTSGDQAPMAEEVRLPNSLAEAMQAFKRDRVVRKVFSHEFAAVLLAQQAEEVRHYDSAVSDVDYMLHMPELYLDGTG